MNSHLFPHIGKVIASTGSRHFPRMLHDLILTQLAVDATHIRQMRVEPVSRAASRGEPGPVKDSAQLAETLFSEHSAAAAHAPHAADSSSVADASQLHLTRRKDGFRYVISVYRNAQSQRFSAQERSLLQDISPVLLPMVEKHISALQPTNHDTATPAEASEGSGLQTLRLRFTERLEQLGLSLSNRETEVCVGLLAGRTAPELAELLQLKVNTVESYLKRAAIKLGISGRHSLMRWMYSPQDTSASTAA
ncbi:helix-turn-helix transcriptional regulator [Pseudomonas monsensis]|uniref:Helix-turn-helix transcriptional regulator n=1 Tax=Pseudomonas monsensis TaxID=2745509 RepID=A0ABT3YTU4_9PSED|nr:helix-turn-helix transcriptional regulator [Pseudomonas monsensis]MCY0108890.1 helix-turn-helix transcriptional regulator [Pseudomonas monsensis]MDZ3826986.1 helix-turn-helix transcriptional regulator [Pseudomonas monsensis]QXH98306.1 helix-turn-helix transcriptional regulator [Pseudomonas monsensis]